MLRNPKLRHELEALYQAKQYKLIAKWFSYWKDTNEMIDKVILFGHFFMPEYFRDESPKFHRGLIKRFFSEQNEYAAAPRGFSKTTLFQACILFSCVNELDKFIVLIEKTFTEASEVLDACRDQCVENDRFIACYGRLLSNRKTLSIAGMPESKVKDAEGDLVINGVRLRAKGFDQPVRGLKSKAWRPTRIVCDDLEQDKHINNPEQRQKYLDNYTKGVLPAVDIVGKVKVFGTILHEDSLLANLIKSHNGVIFRAYYLETDKEWQYSARFCVEIITSEGKRVRLLWASRWSWERLMAKKSEMQMLGKSSNAFEQEYRNNPIAEESRKFKYEWLWNFDRRIRLSALKRSGITLVGYNTLDFADSIKTEADFTGSLVVLIDQHDNWYLVSVRNEKRNVMGKIGLIFENWSNWVGLGLVKIGVEKKAFEDEVVPLLKIEKERRKMYPVVEELKPMGRSKESRILGALEGRFQSGKVWICTDDDDIPIEDTEVLLNQLYNFPSSANDDLSDALAYISDMAQSPEKDSERGFRHRDPIDDDPWATTSHNALIDDDPY